MGALSRTLTRITNKVKFVKNRYLPFALIEFLSSHRKVPVRRVRQALQHVERFIQSCCHDDLDVPPLSPLRESEWDLVFNAHHRIIHQGKKVKALPHHLEVRYYH